MTQDFAYTLFLILQLGNEVPKVQIKHYIQKWFVLSTLTGRYIGSPESQMDRDLRGIASKGFVQFLKENEDALLSDTFWSVRLVQNLETTSVTSPYYSTYLAAQAFNKENSLLSNCIHVGDLFRSAGDVHHIFPKEYLKKSGITDKSAYNQVANYAYLDTGVNISISDKAPSDYFVTALHQCETGEMKIGTIIDEKEFWENLSENCIPAEIIRMTAADYQQFLQKRRAMMAMKIKEYYYSL